MKRSHDLLSAAAPLLIRVDNTPSRPEYLGYRVSTSVEHLGFNLFILFISSNTSAILAAMRTPTPSPELSVSTSAEPPLYRLYLLRCLYALIGVGQGLQTWPLIIHHTHPWDFWRGVGMSFLGALTALALLGVRYPVRMIPLLFFEFAWKLLWTVSVWLPVTLSHTVNADVRDNAFAIIMGVVLVPLVLPWGYVWKNYVAAPSGRWR